MIVIDLCAHRTLLKRFSNVHILIHVVCIISLPHLKNTVLWICIANQAAIDSALIQWHWALLNLQAVIGSALIQWYWALSDSQCSRPMALGGGHSRRGITLSNWPCATPLDTSLGLRPKLWIKVSAGVTVRCNLDRKLRPVWCNMAPGVELHETHFLSVKVKLTAQLTLEQTASIQSDPHFDCLNRLDLITSPKPLHYRWSQG